MSAPLLSKTKRPLSPPPKEATVRRVRPRIGSTSGVNSVAASSAKQREDSPEEGEVEEDDLPLSLMQVSQQEETPAPNTNGADIGAGPNEDETMKDANPAIPEKSKKVAFPFKSRAAKVQAIPTVDMENGPARPAPNASPSKGGDFARGSGGGGSQNGAGRDTYIPSRGRDTYVPSRNRDRASPKGGQEQKRSWSPPHREEDADGQRRARSRSPVEGWDTYIAPKYQDPEGRMRGGRLMDTYIAPDERNSERAPWGRSPPRSSVGADSYRPHGRSPPPRDRSPPERGSHNWHSPEPAPHRLPPRPPSPDRYFPPRHDDWQRDNSSRDQGWDRAQYPGPSTRSPLGSFERPPLPNEPMEPGMDGSARPRVLLSRHGDGAAVLLQQQQQSLSQSLPPRPITFPTSQEPTMYNKPIPGSIPAVPQPAEPTASASSGQKSKPSKHKVARVRTKDEEQAAYGRVFVGSGRINEYMMLNKLGEGTFGEVHRARRCDAPEGLGDVALKRIIMHSEKDGMPITALREIKILKALSHPNIVKVLDIVVQPRTPSVAGSVYMVFPYMDHDLAGLLDNKAVQLAQSHIKIYMKQLLEGLEYMHENHIIHRDIKAANILISNEGVLQIADFGLARAYTKKTKKERLEESNRRKGEKYTNCVVTRWYRPPELLLGERLYGAEIDLWGVGCILAEMFVRRPVFQGQSDMDQLEKIWWLCGTPTRETWPDFDNLPGLDGVKEFKPRPKGLNDFLRRYDSITREAYDLIDVLLSLDPAKRPTASAALLHDYFWTTPLPADPKTLPKYEASHELDRRRKELVPPPAPPPKSHQHSHQFPHGHGGQFNHRGRGRGGGHQQRHFHQGPPNMGPLPPGLPMHPGMHALPPVPHHGEHFNQPNGGPPSTGLPPPRGFRPPPPPRSYPNQPPYPGNNSGRPPGPNPGMPPRDRGPPPPPNDSVVLHYG